MKNIIVILILTISPILAQCDWNGDNQVDVLDVVATVDCIMSASGIILLIQSWISMGIFMKQFQSVTKPG